MGLEAGGDHWLFWLHSPGLWLTTMWGHPTTEEAAALFACYDLGLAADSEFVSLADCSRLQVVEPALFGALGDYMHARRDPFHRLMSKQALVRPGGLPGSVVAGFYEVLGYSLPVQVFTEVRPALQWLASAAAPEILGELAARVGRALDEPPVVRELRGLLVDQPALDVADAARLLGRSVRTLQRQLGVGGASFRRVRTAARIARAQQLLIESDDKVTAIALDVGCGSLQHFVRLFRAQTGETPQEWRTRRRR